ncbi:MAG: murein L,D-transpeptidase, partial [Burkholderiales bacterium]
MRLMPLWFALTLSAHAWAWSSGTGLREHFAREVDRRLDVPEHEQAYYAHRIEGALAAEKLELAAPQFILLVDRSRWVQAALLYWMS